MKHKNTIFFLLAIGICFFAFTVLTLAIPSKNIKWVKIYPNGYRLNGEMIYTGEGSGYENPPDDFPGLTIYRYDSEISLKYTDKSKRQLIIGIPRDAGNMQVNACYSDGKYLYEIQVFNGFVNLWENVGGERVALSYSREFNAVERNLYLNDGETPWEGVVAELTPGAKWVLRVYTNGRIGFTRDNLTLDEVDKFRKKFSQPSDKDYHDYAYNKIENSQKMIVGTMDVPLLFNTNFISLDREYFRSRYEIYRNLRSRYTSRPIRVVAAED